MNLSLLQPLDNAAGLQQVGDADADIWPENHFTWLMWPKNNFRGQI